MYSLFGIRENMLKNKIINVTLMKNKNSKEDGIYNILSMLYFI